MHYHMELALALGAGTLNAAPMCGQAFQPRPQLVDSWVALTGAPGPESAAPLTLEAMSGRRGNPLATRGARIGLAVGMAVGVVYWSARKCGASGCFIKWTFMPVGAALFGFGGALIGAAVDGIASTGAPFAHPALQLRAGIALGF